MAGRYRQIVVVFTEQVLGMFLVPGEGGYGAFVQHLERDPGGGHRAAERSGKVKPGFQLSAINDVSVMYAVFSSIVGILRDSPRPLRIVFVDHSVVEHRDSYQFPVTEEQALAERSYLSVISRSRDARDKDWNHFLARLGGAGGMSKGLKRIARDERGVISFSDSQASDVTDRYISLTAQSARTSAALSLLDSMEASAAAGLSSLPSLRPPSPNPARAPPRPGARPDLRIRASANAAAAAAAAGGSGGSATPPREHGRAQSWEAVASVLTDGGHTSNVPGAHSAGVMSPIGSRVGAGPIPPSPSSTPGRDDDSRGPSPAIATFKRTWTSVDGYQAQGRRVGLSRGQSGAALSAAMAAAATASAQIEMSEYARRLRAELEALVQRGVPDALRGSVWFELSGARAKMALHPTGYYQSLLQHGADRSTIKAIRKDLPRTFPGHPQTESKAGQLALQNVLVAAAVHNPEIGYCQAMNFVAATLLLVLDEEQAFWVLDVIINEIFPENYYGGDLAGAHTDQLVLEQLIRTFESDVYFTMRKTGVSTRMFTSEWFMAIFTTTMPMHTTLRIFDMLFLHGSEMLFRVAVALIHMHSRRILLTGNDLQAMYSFLKSMTFMVHDEDALLMVARPLANQGHGFNWGDFGSAKLAKIREAASRRREDEQRQLDQRHQTGLAANSPLAKLREAREKAEAEQAEEKAEVEGAMETAGEVVVTASGDEAGQAEPAAAVEEEAEPAAAVEEEAEPAAAVEEEAKPAAAVEDEPEPAAAADEEEAKPAAADEQEAKPAAAVEEEAEPAAAVEEEAEPAAAVEEEAKPAAAVEDEPEPAAAADEQEAKPAAAVEEEAEPAAAVEEEAEPAAADEEEAKPAAAVEEEAEPAAADEEEAEPEEEAKPAADEEETKPADEEEAKPAASNGEDGAKAAGGGKKKRRRKKRGKK